MERARNAVLLWYVATHVKLTLLVESPYIGWKQLVQDESACQHTAVSSW